MPAPTLPITPLDSLVSSLTRTSYWVALPQSGEVDLYATDWLDSLGGPVLETKVEIAVEGQVVGRFTAHGLACLIRPLCGRASR